MHENLTDPWVNPGPGTMKHNTEYDGVLRFTLILDVKLVGFADDITLVWWYMVRWQ